MPCPLRLSAPSWCGLALKSSLFDEMSEIRRQMAAGRCFIIVPYYMKFWRHFNLAILAIFEKIAKLNAPKLSVAKFGSVLWSWVVGRGYQVVCRGYQVVGRES